MKSYFTTKILVKTALIAAVYAVVTLVFAPISYGQIQFRISEILVLLAFIDHLYIPGLVLGCLIENFTSPLGPIDTLVGTSATLVSTVFIFWVSRYTKGNTTMKLFQASLMPVIFNAIFVGWELYFVLGLPLLLSMIYVAVGEFIVVSLAGVVVFSIILKNKTLVQLLDIREE